MTGFRLYWLLWLVVGFALPETYGLLTKPERTLSETVWSWFGVMRGQPIGQWSVQHYILLAFMTWLFFHLAFRIFR